MAIPLKKLYNTHRSNHLAHFDLKKGFPEMTIEQVKLAYVPLALIFFTLLFLRPKNQNYIFALRALNAFLLAIISLRLNDAFETFGFILAIFMIAVWNNQNAEGTGQNKTKK